MLLTTLPLLCCPSITDGSSICAGNISVLEASKTKNSDIISGILICKKCESIYPILSGVAVLVNDVEQYLLHHVKGVAALMGTDDIPSNFQEAFSQAKLSIETGLTEEDLESQRINALYYMNHYLRAKNDRAWWRPKKENFSKEINYLIKKYWNNGPFSKIEVWTKKLKNQKVIELGCGVGGLAQVFSKTASSYLGVDSSFASIALARHIYLNTPYPLSIKIPQDLYEGPLTGKVEVPTQARKCKNVDFVVAELECLPIVLKQFDLCIALNAIDMVADPSELPKLQYSLLKEGGIVIQSCPYIWQKEVAEQLRTSLPAKIRSSSAAVEYLYKQCGFEIFKKIEHLPWLFLKHFRQIEMYSVHLFAARKVNK